jgi:hypothetical protein
MVVALFAPYALAWGCYSSIAPTPVIELYPDSGLPITTLPDAADACVPRKPWEGPGVTGVLPIGNSSALVLNGERYFIADFNLDGDAAWDPNLGSVLAWHETGLLENYWANAPLVDGLRPWDGPGVTAAYLDKASGAAIIISQYRRWTRSGTQWTAAGSIADDWRINGAGPTLLDGQVPWEGVGVTAAYFTPNGDRFYAISQDKAWIRDTQNADPKSWTWIPNPDPDAGNEAGPSPAPGAFALAGSVDWNNAPTVDGKRPYDDPGVTTAYYILPKFFVVSVDKMWTGDGRTWNESGHLRDMPGWSSAPSAGCGN